MTRLRRTVADTSSRKETQMKAKRPTTIAEYIVAAAEAGQPHLRRLYVVLKQAAPRAQEVITWGNPVFEEPRFLFAISAHKAHLSFAPGTEAMETFRQDLRQHTTTKHFLKVAYGEPLPADLIRRIAEHRVKVVGERQDDGFW
jgi:uncharacterized protein YdhG (YjbR/CyaY superfamily)